MINRIRRDADREGMLFYKRVIQEISEIFGFFFQAEDGIRDYKVTGVQTCALPILKRVHHSDEREQRDQKRANLHLWMVIMKAGVDDLSEILHAQGDMHALTIDKEGRDRKSVV